MKVAPEQDAVELEVELVPAEGEPVAPVEPVEAEAEPVEAAPEPAAPRPPYRPPCAHGLPPPILLGRDPVYLVAPA